MVLLALLPPALVVEPLGGVGSPATILGVALFLAWACFALTPGLGVRTCVPVRVALSGFWVSTLASYGLLHRRSVPQVEANTADTFVIMLVAFTGVALTAAECLRSREEVILVVRAAVAGATFSAVVALLQFLGYDATVHLAKIPLLAANHDVSGLTSRGSFNRPAGTAIHPIEFGVATAVATAFALHLLIYDEGAPRWRRRLCMGLLALAIPVSISRSALVVALVVVVYFVVAAPARLRIQSALAMAGFGAVVFMAIPGLLGTLRNLVVAGPRDSSISTRIGDYAAVAEYIRPNPWYGRGPGTFLPNYRILDNQYLLTLVEMGVVGMVTLLVLFAMTTSLGVAARRLATNEADRNLSQMFRAAGMGLLVALATFDGLSFPTLTASAALWLGLAGAWWLTLRQPAPDPAATSPVAPAPHEERSR